MSMSDPLLPVPDEGSDAPETDQEEFHEVEDVEQPDVLRGPADHEHGAEAPEETPFRAPVAGDRLTPEELEQDLREE